MIVRICSRVLSNRPVIVLAAVLLCGAATRAADYRPYWPAEGKAHPLCGHARRAAEQLQQDLAYQQWQSDYEAQRAAGLREALEDTDVLHCNLEIEIFPGQEDNIAGTNVMTVQSKSAALTTFTIRLRYQYNITGITVNGTPVSYSSTNTSKVVTLDRTYTTDEIFTLEVSYYGHAESPGFGSIEFGTHLGADIIYTLSEPYFAYTWWPCKDGNWGQAGDNADKFTLDMAVIAPDNMVTASNGLLQGIDIFSGNRKRYRWSSSYPICTYLVCFSSTNYNTWTVNYSPIAGGSMPVDFYIYPEHDNATNRDAWEVVLDALYVYRDLFGEYPFVNEKYGIYECQFGGGMEHQTFTAQGTFIESVSVHELAHQWWGDMVTCKTWNHIWLNEGFASYAEALWAEFESGTSDPAARKAAMAAMKYTGGGTVYVQDEELGSIYDIFDGGTTYNKAGWVLHMLRHVLGDDSFFDMLAAYRASFEYSAATTGDLQAVCESFYGGSLDWFFSEWIYGEYNGQYHWGWDQAEINGSNYVLVSIDQIQPSEQLRFTMPIDLSIDGVVHVVWNDADPENFVIPVDGTATEVLFDPGRWVLNSNSKKVSYSPGPPKIVETAPAPGAEIESDAATDTVSVWFQTNVNASAGDLSLVGNLGGPVGFTLADGSDVNPIVLDLDAPLAPDAYTLTVADNVIAVDSGQSLDGEITDPADRASLPSGEGTPGGSAVIQFVVIQSTPGDMDGDGDVDLNDFATFALCFHGAAVTTPPGGCTPVEFAGADLDDDGDVDLGDFSTFALDYTG
jgi:aminopeptidase N